MNILVVNNAEDGALLEDKINSLTKLTHSLLSELEILVVTQPEEIIGSNDFYSEVRRFEINNDLVLS
jgi:hypothetical protein